MQCAPESTKFGEGLSRLSRVYICPPTLTFDLPKFNHLVPCGQAYDWQSLVTIGLELVPGSCSQTYISTDAGKNIISHHLHLMFYYQSVVRPVFEYASPCWHLNLTKEQTEQLEDVQQRALQVIFGNIPYDEVHRTHNIPTLAERRLDLSRTFFKRIIRDNSNVL